MTINVAFVTTWGAPCGISTYSEELTENLVNEDLRIQVLAPKLGGSLMAEVPAGIPARPIWTPSGRDTPFEITRAATGVDIIHFQHEFGLFDSDIFIQTLKDVKRKGIKTVVTFHTVKPYGAWEYTGFFDLVRQLADVILVHTTIGCAAVSLAKGSAPVIWMPHGSKINVEKGNRERGFELLGIEKKYWDATFGGSLGFIGENKNIVSTVKAFADGVARRMIGNCGFIICGESKDQLYRSSLLHLIKTSGYSLNFFIYGAFIARDKIKDIMSVFDFGVLNTTSDCISASGQVHLYAAYGIPLAVANRPIYHEAIQGGAIPFDLTDRNEITLSTVNAIASLAYSKNLRALIGKSLKEYAVRTGWDVIAKRHAEIYRGLMK